MAIKKHTVAVYKQWAELGKDEDEYYECERYEVRDVKRGSPPYGYSRFTVPSTDREAQEIAADDLNRGVKRRMRAAARATA
jgi:hypothetical protein